MPPVQQAESYESIETRIQAAIEVLKQRGEDKPNLSAAAREFNLPPNRLRARWGGRQSKMDRPAANRKLTEEQELAVCQYLDRLETIGTSATMHMLIGCANWILKSAHTDPEVDPPVVGAHWAPRFLERHPEYFAKMREVAIPPPPPPPATPPPSDASPQIPLTIRSLKRQGSDLQREFASRGMPPSLQRRLKVALQGGLVQAQAGALAAADLSATRAAERARAAGQRSRHGLQEGGVLYAEEARNMERRRLEEHVKKAEAALQRARHAVKKIEKAERKPFLDAAKECRKQMRASCASQKKIMKALCAEIRRVGRNRARRM